MIGAYTNIIAIVSMAGLPVHSGKSALVDNGHTHQWLLIETTEREGEVVTSISIDRAYAGDGKIDGKEFPEILMRFSEKTIDGTYTFEFLTAIDCKQDTFAYVAGWSPDEPSASEPRAVQNVQFQPASEMTLLTRRVVYKQACGTGWNDEKWEALLEK